MNPTALIAVGNLKKEQPSSKKGARSALDDKKLKMTLLLCLKSLSWTTGDQKK